MHLILKYLNFTLCEFILLHRVTQGFFLLLTESLVDGLRCKNIIFFSLSRFFFLLCGQLALKFELYMLLVVPLRINLPLHILVEFF
jgi:hypothetical protein